MEDLARLAGVSKMTVSLALRNHPNVSEPRRRQIHALAQKHGYVVDPELSSLARAIRKRSEKEPPRIAMLEFHEIKEAGIFAEYVRRNRQNLFEEAQRRGFQLQEFHLSRDHIPPKRLRRILIARGIKGLIMGHHHADDPFVAEFDVTDFSCVYPFAEAASRGLPSAGGNQYECALAALEAAWERGYRRPGLMIYTPDYLQNWHWREGAFYYFIHSRGLSLIPPLTLPAWSPPDIRAWLDQHRPDVVLAPFSHTAGLLRDLGYRVPEDMGFAALHLLRTDDHSIAGIDVRTRAQAGALIDVVIDQMNRNVRGRQEDPPRIYISGRWMDGDTLPRRKPAR